MIFVRQEIINTVKCFLKQRFYFQIINYTQLSIQLNFGIQQIKYFMVVKLKIIKLY